MKKLLMLQTELLIHRLVILELNYVMEFKLLEGLKKQDKIIECLELFQIISRLTLI